MEPHVWKEAEVSFPDFAGHAELDFRKTNTALADAGIDKSRWHVIGFEWHRSETLDQVYVIAVDKTKTQSESGPVHATKILMHDVDPAQFLHSITHSFSMTLRSRNRKNAEIVIDELGDIPEQD